MDPELKLLRKRLFINNSGSVIVDAAICLPIFIVCMAIMMMLIIQCGVEDAEFTKLVKSAESSCDIIAASGSEYGGFSECYKDICLDNVITIDKRVDTAVPVPKSFEQGIDAYEVLTYRAFVGESKQFSVVNEVQIYVFPKYGERYHIAGCKMFRIYPDNYIVMFKNEAIEKGYTPCKLCGGGEW